MTTTMAPDPASLKSWEEAFQYPLPTVRQLTVRLRRDIDDHRSRLRSLVGTSYRDLLGTAERIIEMDKQIQSVEGGLSDIGRRCNSGILERSDVNYTKLERAWSQQGGQEKELRSTAQCKILGAALSAVSRLIRSGGNPLQAAKLMVLTRLLYKSLSEAEAVPVVLERHRSMIASLRSKLLAYIDRKVGREESSTEELVGALSAYALLTSSTPKDVLKHLLAVRVAQLETLTSSSTTDSILQALGLHTATFVSVQAVFPKRLAEALSSLSKVTLLSDKHIKSVEELNLDIYGRWIDDNIRSFTPWVQQESLTAQDGRQAMSDYSTDARTILLGGLKQCLAGVGSAEEVLSVRKKVVGASLSIGTRIRMEGFQDQLEEIRQTFLERMEELIQGTAVLDGFDPVPKHSSSTKGSIWHLASGDIDLSSGGMHFRKAVLRQRNGHDVAFDQVLAPFEAWRRRAEALWSNIEAMHATKWDEHFETDLDDAEDEETAPYQDMFSNEDALRLEKRLHSSVQVAVKAGSTRLEKAIRQESGQPQFYLRLLREIHSQQLALYQTLALQDAPLSFNDLSAELHAQLAQTIASHGLEALSSAYTRRHFILIELWEGEPKLPLQPLPATFKFVMTIQQEMTKVGEDVWSTAGVAVLKEAIAEKLLDVLPLKIVSAVANGHKEEGTDAVPETKESVVQAEANHDAAAGTESQTDENVEDKPSDAAPASEDTSTIVNTNDTVDLSLEHTQRLFDAVYLSKVFSTNDKLSEILRTLKSRAALSKIDTQRLEKNATEYWKKTYLLFGLLARSSKSYSR